MFNASSDYKLFINSLELLGDLKPHIIGLEHEDSFSETGKVEFTIKDFEGFDISPDYFKLEAPVELLLGYGNDLSKVFAGDIVSVGPDYPKDEVSSLKITAYDRSYILKKVPKPKVYTNPNMLRMAKEIAKDNGLEIIINPENILKDYKFKDDQSITQIDETDWQLLNKLAEVGNYKLFIIDNTIYLVDDNYLLTEQENKFAFIYNPFVNELDYETILPCLSFNPSVGVKDQRIKVEVIAWASKDTDGQKYGKADIENANTEGDSFTQIKIKTGGSQTLTITGVTAKTDAQAKTIATAELQRRADNLVIVEATIKGNHLIRFGQKHTFKLNGLGDYGKQYSGDYMITDYTNNIVSDEGGYITTLKLRRSGLTPL